jgi:thiol-disulfide isomerase/thioredoxin
MKKFLIALLMIGLIACLLIGCNVTTPSEGEGEGEGEDETTNRIVLVELFMSMGCPSCSVVEPILEQLAEEYDRTEMILVEEAGWGLYSTIEISDRYKWYLPSSSDRSTPNILFNGLNHKIQGDSTYSTIKSKIETELNKDANISISATRSSDSTTTTISGTIKNIGSSALDNLVINGMTFRDRGQTGLKYSVTDIFSEQQVVISTLDSGSSYNFSFTIEDINWDVSNINGVVFVQDTDSSKKEVLQSFYVD